MKPPRLFAFWLTAALLFGALLYSYWIEHECRSVGQIIVGSRHYECREITLKEHR